MLTYHPEDHGSGADALGIGGHTGVVAGIFKVYLMEAEGQDFLVTVIMEVVVFKDAELQPEEMEMVYQGWVGVRKIWGKILIL